MSALAGALARFNRALDLIPFLSSNPGLSIEEIATHFHVSPAEISKDLATLHMCGLPGYSHLELIDLAYDDDVVTIIEGQNLSQPRNLTINERTAILLGLEMVKSLNNADPFLSKIEALQSRFRTADVARIVDSVDTSHAVNPGAHHGLIVEAIRNNQQLRITYISASSNSRSERDVAPLYTYQIGEHFYLTAFCFNAGQIRHFRTDRISACEVLASQREVPAVDGPHGEESEIKVLLDSQARLFIEDHRELVISEERVGDRILVTFAIGDVDWLLKALLAEPGSCAILEPISAIERIEEIAASLKNLYN